MRGRVTRRAAVAAMAAVLLLTGCGGGGSSTVPSASNPVHVTINGNGSVTVGTTTSGAIPTVVKTTPAQTTTTPATTPYGGPRPNIVFVLTDDLSFDLLQYMPQVQRLEAHGVSFSNYFVTDSLCCPSRTSIFTGLFPHDSGVYDNVGSEGGFDAFYNHGLQSESFNVALQKAGYVTAMMGKYLNGYLEPAQSPTAGTYVPPGWNEWDVAGDGYNEFNYTLNIDGKLYPFGDARQDYLTDVISRRGRAFIDAATNAHRPFFLELATFSPHRPYVPAPRDAGDFSGLTAPRPPNYDRLPTHPPRWLQGRPPLNSYENKLIDKAFRERAQSVQAVDRMILKIEHQLSADGVARDTYIVFSSDNGLHTGEYRLTPGKLTAFDTDIHVPLIVDGPGVPQDDTVSDVAENIDLAKTFGALGHARVAPDDGHSLAPLIQGVVVPGWRDAALIEHHGPAIDPYDPDRQGAGSGNPPSYEAIRTTSFLYVSYVDGEHEYYDLKNDPYELHNLYYRLSSSQRDALEHDLSGMENCHTGRTCWASSHIPPLPGTLPTAGSG